MQSPGGAAKLSPALQRGVEWNDDVSPGGTTDGLSHPIQVVILSAAGTSRSEAPAESKDPCILTVRKEALGNSPRKLGTPDPTDLPLLNILDR